MCFVVLILLINVCLIALISLTDWRAFCWFHRARDISLAGMLGFIRDLKQTTTATANENVIKQKV